KISSGQIDVHPTENAIIVNYYIQGANSGEEGYANEKRPIQKTIRIKSLGPSVNLQALARDIVEKSKIIHPSRLKDVEQTLYYLQKRQMENEASTKGSQIRKQVDEIKPNDYDKPISDRDPVSSMDLIEQYIEGLYEEIPEKVESTRQILQLARNPENLEILMQNGAQFPDNMTLVKELEQEHQKFQAMIRKQDQLLFEDIGIEVKMVKRGIVKYLMTMLDRKTPELLVLAITFLKKLSIFRENKDEMIRNQDDMLMKFHDIIPSEHQAVQTLSLRLFLNLSHDVKFRQAIVTTGFLEKLIDLLHSKSHVLLTLQLLYQLSIDDKNKDAFAKTDALGLIIKMVLEYKGERVNVELMAVAINLATSRKNAELICEDNGLKFLMRRALKTRDTLILKMIKNVAEHEGDIKMLFLDHIDDMMHLLLRNAGNQEIMAEVLGIMSSLTIADFDFAKLAEAYGLLEFIQKRLALSLSTTVKAATANTRGDMLERGGIAEDDDVTLQEINEDWVKKIKQQKFQWHNSEYLTVVAQAASEIKGVDGREVMHGEGDRDYMYSYDSDERREGRQYDRGEADTDDETGDYEHLIGGTNALLEGP
ncbi:hypothetical protein HDU76_003351, partial [Blyttiomyces sp. JEL0837]